MKVSNLPSPDPSRVYNGKACFSCGKTLRWKSNHMTVCRCDRKAYDRKHQQSLWEKSHEGMLRREKKRASDRRYLLRKQGVEN